MDTKYVIGQSTPSASASCLPQRYLLATNIPVFEWEGHRYTDDLWLRDIIRHLDYLECLTIFCPVEHCPPHEGCSEIPNAAPFDQLSIRGVHGANSILGALMLSPAHMLHAWQAVGDADIVQGGGVGWPVPLGYYCAVAAFLRKKFHISIMESSTWRDVAGHATSMKRSARAFIMERMASMIARRSELALFTTEAYRDSMVGRESQRAHVFKASWIPDQFLLSPEESKTHWETRMRRRTPDLRVGFASRLVREKGVEVVLQAARLLDSQLCFEIEIVGDGPCLDLIRHGIETSPDNVSIKLLGTTEYGKDFFAVIDRWDATLVPSLSDEQPRIVYDSFARGVPTLVSETTALAECVEAGKNGLLFAVGDPEALARCLNFVAKDRSYLAHLAVAARDAAAHHTHAGMHAQRRQLIDNAWLSWTARAGRSSQHKLA